MSREKLDSAIEDNVFLTGDLEEIRGLYTDEKRVSCTVVTTCLSRVLTRLSAV